MWTFEQPHKNPYPDTKLPDVICQPPLNKETSVGNSIVSALKDLARRYVGGKAWRLLPYWLASKLHAFRT